GNRRGPGGNPPGRAQEPGDSFGNRERQVAEILGDHVPGEATLLEAPAPEAEGRHQWTGRGCRTNDPGRATASGEDGGPIAISLRRGGSERNDAEGGHRTRGPSTGAGSRRSAGGGGLGGQAGSASPPTAGRAGTLADSPRCFRSRRCDGG